jgi:serine protease Do
MKAFQRFVRGGLFSSMPTRARQIALALLLALALLTMQAVSVSAAPVSPELQKRVRTATFEVVLAKPETERVTYEKTLPLELLPFQERTDKYRAVGTAFAIAPGQYVSAGHVMLAAVGGQFGAPALRDSGGNVYPIDQVLKFSLHEDFMVFSVANAPGVEPLEANTTLAIDDPVLAVGNALGDGVVIRDGLLTSMTPEEQDGRWKWLRFSAAASPGNSGGPLLDTTGKVVGIVIARSESENLNYALPIERVLNAPASAASYDSRQSFGLPMLQNKQVAVFKGTFRLPVSFANFSKSYLDARLKFYTSERDRLLHDSAAELFPNGQSSKVLAASNRPDYPALIVQKDDHTWSVEDGGAPERADLPGEGSVEVRFVGETALFSIVRGREAHDDGFYTDSGAFIETLLKGMKLTRSVGMQSVRVISAGVAARDTLFADVLRRRWQLRTWPLGYVDLSLVVAALPTPDGYVGMLRFAGPGDVDRVTEEVTMLTGYFETPFNGTLAQWRAHLARKSLLPEALASLKLERTEKDGLSFESTRLHLKVPPSAVKLTEESLMRIDLLHMLDGKRLVSDIGAVKISRDHLGETYFAAYRQPKPDADAGRDLAQRWLSMMNRKEDFDGTVRHEPDYRAVWIRSSLGTKMDQHDLPDAASDVLYEIAYRTDDPVLPREMDQRRSDVMRGIRILEK